MQFQLRTWCWSGVQRAFIVETFLKNEESVIATPGLISTSDVTLGFQLGIQFCGKGMDWDYPHTQTDWIGPLYYPRWNGVYGRRSYKSKGSKFDDPQPILQKEMEMTMMIMMMMMMMMKEGKCNYDGEMSRRHHANMKEIASAEAVPKENVTQRLSSLPIRTSVPNEADENTGFPPSVRDCRIADDMTLLAEEEMILRDMLLELNDSCEQYGMKINANKTKTMVIGRKI
ncbi:hypothetical protein ANN_10579 [Periplaneta americana]|uniref:Reverse transcriptase domain-containing protein n=1 Tax=Periplaneta americana TaxID=6978 RepID=A0ABQ8TRQ0_PERAM|nr:hypothetical protein ANN_10579 [Periplaneta americana]